MKPELSKEVVIGNKQPSLVRTRRIGRKIFRMLPSRVYDTLDESSPEVRRIPVNNRDQAVELAHGLRRRIDGDVLARGVHIEPEVGHYAVHARIASYDTDELEVTRAELEILSSAGRHTKMLIHVDEVREELNYDGLIPADASVMVQGTDGEKYFGDGDFHPAERPSARHTIETVFSDIVTAPDLHVHREY